MPERISSETPDWMDEKPRPLVTAGVAPLELSVSHGGPESTAVTPEGRPERQRLLCEVLFHVPWGHFLTVG